METLESLRSLIIDAVEKLDEEKVLEFSEQALRYGMEPFTLLETINEGMQRVGELYENKTYFIADLIMAGIIFKEVLKIDQMLKSFQSDSSKKIGKIVLGTVKGDVHDIGKDIFRGMVETKSFEVIDLGVDVPGELFLEKVKEYKPEILGLSGVLTYTTDAMREVVEKMKEAGLRDQLKIIIGGSFLTEDTCLYTGADGFARDALNGVKICSSWIGEGKGKESK
ncbi:cobalamin B12-binding domain-containing protein [Candidatus Contubernalis alkaliaceticus]|uniref:cobalamin B12-binding domain-containing protein n=1 Tax=Candidatus Contubernalis alkaliaceticus TaxID=338645 RepID=UPI001F4C4833|nr:cobalamin-dependent protein [Candidatus Contubernalis alkalaceticus]UNC91349.1 cobalamin B12-binding domain-containing protein [Candidatus Contubernalis alkalaceticus]